MTEKGTHIPPNQWPRKLVFKDPTPNGIINQRILTHAVAVLAKEAGLDKHVHGSTADGELFMRLVLLVCRKMSSVWLHLDRFTKEQGALVATFESRQTQPYVPYMECSDTLFLEFDEFLVQIKSTLDYIVKIPRAVVGKSWQLYRFGDKGRDVIKAMRNNLPKEFKGKAELIEKHLFQKANLDWLDFTIRARDDMNHYLMDQVRVERFGVYRDEAGVVHVPMWNKGQTLAEFMTQIWGAFLYFTEDFITLFASLRFPEGTALHLKPRNPTSTESPWKVVSKVEVDFIRAINEGTLRFGPSVDPAPGQKGQKPGPD